MTGTKGIGESAGKVTDLTYVNRNIRVIGAGSDGEWMPLVVTDIRTIQEEPLSWLVLHAGLRELDLDSI